jgi:hypothetical protein
VNSKDYYKDASSNLGANFASLNEEINEE